MGLEDGEGKRHARKWEQPEQMNRGEKWHVVVLATSRMELQLTRWKRAKKPSIWCVEISF